MGKTLHILPSTGAVEAFNRAALAAGDVLFGTHALTLKRLAEEIGQAAEKSRRPVSEAGRKLLLEELVRQHYADKPGQLAALRDFPGFIDALDSFFGELKQAVIAPRQFAAIIRSLPGNGRLAELASLYTLYAEILGRHGVCDRHDLELAALHHLREEGTLPPLFDGVAALATANIYDLTPLQLALLAELSRRIPLTLRLPYNPDREPLYAYAAKTAYAIEALDNSALKLEPEFVEPTGTFLTPLLAAVFDGATWQGPGERMALLAAPGVYRECEEIGRRIRTLMEGGTDPAAIAVLFRDIEPHGSMLEDVCRRFAIPVSYRRGAPLATSPLVRACLAPFTVILSRLNREELLALCKSSYLGIGDALPPDAIEEVLLAANYIDETLGTAEDAIGRRAAALRRREIEPVREERVLRVLRPLLAELRRFKGDKPLREFIALLENFVATHRVYRQGLEAADRRALKRDASAITLFQQVLRGLETDLATLGMAERKFSPADFLRLLHEGMAGVYLAGERRAGVAIMTFHDARGLSFPHLFIGGLNEGICPKSHSGHPLFKDSDKARCQSTMGGKPFRSAAEKGLEEPLLFYLAMGCAETSLTFSYSYVDSRGNTMLRSPFLDEVLAVVPLAEEREPVNRITPEPPACLEREELLNSLAARRWFTLPAGTEFPLPDTLARIAATAAIEEERERFFSGVGPAGCAPAATTHTGFLSREDIRAELREFYASPAGNSFAPTTLEEYGVCPFRYFLRRLLRVLPVEKPDLELEVRDAGSLVHEILQGFFQQRQAAGRLPLRGDEADREAMHNVAGEVFARWEAERYTGEPLLWEVAREKLLPLLDGFVAREGEDRSGLVPMLFEREFAPLEIDDLRGGSLFLRGKIDRVDADAASGRLRVVDYKLGGNGQKYREFLKQDAMGETSFQMPVYLLAAARELEREHGLSCNSFSALFWLLRRLDPVGRDYVATGDGVDFFAVDPGSRARAGDGNFLNRLCAKVQAMREGDFRISPQNCDYCDFTGVCRHVKGGLAEEG
jgi:ATP-dependent helicase/DNAse subunit B